MAGAVNGGAALYRARFTVRERIAESFHPKVWDQFLGCQVFESLRTATSLGSLWRRQHDDVRSHCSLGYNNWAELE